MKLEVPYYSQFVDVTDSFWMLRACGATSLKMVAEYHGVDVADIISLCNEAKDRGGYDMQNGWIHDYLITKAKELGLTAFRKEGIKDLDEIKSFLDNGNPVIVSVEKRVLEQKRFHIIVLVGYEQVQASQAGIGSVENDSEVSIDCFYYHEPESTDNTKGAFRSCTEETFLEYFRGKALFITK